MTSVYVLGSGKVGSALARGWRKAGFEVTLRSARKPLPRRIASDLVVLAVRDDALVGLAQALVIERGAVVHCAGALDETPLAALRSDKVAIGRMHPLLSFADRKRPPALEGGYAHLCGDARAVRVATRAARALGMVPLTVSLDPVRYHAAAALLANGAVALAGVAAALIAEAGVEGELAPRMLAPLLASVAQNLENLGMPDALTGPVRRGDLRGIRRHLAAMGPDAASLYRALAKAQLPMARALGEAEAEKYEAMEAELR
jgi:predicted short-subunit dehydrogenase-like oxidoreductase (DUF2520 family)